MNRKYPSQTLKQVLLRIPDSMRERLEKEAAEGGRSLTAVILARLESTFPKEEAWLNKTAQSPLIRLEKLLLATEVRLEARIEALESEVAALRALKR
jgi:hypothetical protein